MKKLIIISSILIAFSAANLFAGNNNSNAQLITAGKTSMDTVPKKDTLKKKKDSVTFQIKERK